MARFSFYALILGIAILFSACAPKHSDIIVAEYGKYDINMGDFEKAYAKNSGGFDNAKNDSVQQYDKFLDLFLNYRMKLRDAEVRDYPNDKAINDEINQYRETVGKTYLIERDIVDKGVKKLYDRRKWEIRVSHILIRQDSIGADAAKAKAEVIIEKLNNGADFSELAKEYSDDQFSKNDGGDIYYLTAGQINIPEFEDAMYELKPGEFYSKPVHTRYGYHVVKVTEKNERRYKIKASHILIDFVNAEGKLDTAGALAKVTHIYNTLQKGFDFADMAKEASEDKGSGAKGGDLGFFERRMMVKEFDEAAFKLKVGEMSGIVKSKFGYHIIKLTDEQPYPPFDKVEEGLKTMYRKYRYDYDYNQFVDGLREKYNYSLSNGSIDRISLDGDTTTFGNYNSSKWRNSLKDMKIFTIGQKEFILDSLVSAVKEDAGFTEKNMSKDMLLKAVDKYSGDELIMCEVNDLENNNSEFADLMKEYRNGIYIFKIQEEEVWNKIDIDSLKLQKFWEQTKNDYTFGDRVEFNEIFTKSDSLAHLYFTKLNNGEDFGLLAQQVTERKGYRFKKGYFGIVKVDDSDMSQLANSLSKNGEIGEPKRISGGWTIVQLIKKHPARIKTFDEARPEVASLLQEKESKKLEQDYLKKLDKVYEPVLYYDELENAFSAENTD